MFFRKAAFALLLVLLGLAGNALALPISFGVMFIFGSIFAVVAVLTLGLGTGTAVALVASGYTWVLWNHPYAIVIFTCEAVWIGLARRRGHTNVLTIDMAYWLLVGGPLIAFFYDAIMGLGHAAAGMIFLKQAVNGVFNALVAWIVVSFLQPERWFDEGRPRRISYDQVIFQLAAFFLMLPALGLLLFHAYRETDEAQTRIAASIEAESRVAREGLHLWMNEHLALLDGILQLGAAYPRRPSPQLQAELARAHRMHPAFHNVFLGLPDATTYAFHPPVSTNGNSTIGLNFADRAWYRALSATLAPTVSDVFMGRGGVFEPIITVSVPKVENGRMAYFALGAVNLSELESLLERFAALEGTVFTIVDHRGNVVTSTDRNLRPLASLPPHGPEQVRALENGVELHLPGAKRNISIMEGWKNAYFQYEQAVPGTPWRLLTTFPVAPLYAYNYASAAWGLGALGLMFAIMLALAAWVTRLLAAPILSLAKLTENLPARIYGEEQVTWPQTSIVEVRRLIENFKDSSHTLGESFDMLNEYSQHLEAQVAERTADLARLTGDLEHRVVEEVDLRVKGEQLLFQQSRLAAMGEMLGAIAHQWRQPLNALGLTVQNLGEDLRYGKASPAEVEQAVESVMRQIKHMSKTIDDFRNFYQPDKAKTAFDPMRAVGDVLRLMEGRLTQHGIGYRLVCRVQGRTFTNERHIEPSAERIVFGYANEFAHVALNLIENARDAVLARRAAGRPAGGDEIAFEFSAHGDRVRIDVADTGGGIDPKILERVFEPYFTTKGPAQGTGLGLYMSKMILEHMQGTLTVKNGAAGAVFTIELPRPPQEGT